MMIYRLCAEQYKNDISGTGAKIYGGRWNSAGYPMLYTTENISLAVLEILVRTGINLVPMNYFLLKIEIPDNIAVSTLTKSKLKKDWKNDTGYTQFIGNEFIKANKSLILKIPSAIVEEEHNFIFNPEHPDFHKVKISTASRFRFDKRLYIKNE